MEDAGHLVYSWLWDLSAFSLIDYHFWMRYAHILYALAIIALLLVFGGPVLYGASRWIDFGFSRFNLQR